MKSFSLFFSYCRDIYPCQGKCLSKWPKDCCCSLLKWNVVCIVRSLAVKMTLIEVRRPLSVVHSLETFTKAGTPSLSNQLDSNPSYILWARSLSQSFSQFLARDNNLNLVLVADGQMDKWTSGPMDGQRISVAAA